MTDIAWAAGSICMTIIITSVSATWILSTRIGKAESKLDAHLSYHKGQEDTLKTINSSNPSIRVIGNMD